MSIESEYTRGGCHGIPCDRMGTNRRHLLAAASACLVVPATPFLLPGGLDAQVRVTGRTVTHESESPLDAVAVTVVDTSGETIATRFTDENGLFSFIVEGVPTIQLRARRIGYLTVRSPELDLEQLERYRTLTLRLRLAPEAVPVAPLEVVAGRRREVSPVLEGFHHRKERGFGRYITRQDIERRDPPQVTDLLRSVSGVQLRSSGRGRHAIVTTHRGRNAVTGSCPAQIYVDDFHVNRADGRTFRIDDVVTPEEVEGIEVYRGLSTVPAQFLSPRADCGVIVIWTRRGPG